MSTGPVRVVNWNPRRRRVPIPGGRMVRFGRRINNFGDLLGPLIVDALAPRTGQAPQAPPRDLLSIGSILHFATNGATVWGTGFNGKHLALDPSVRRLDIRAVRGPRTADRLGALGFDVPAVYGDPGLLISRLWTREALAPGGTRHSVLVVPNLNDLAQCPGGGSAAAASGAVGPGPVLDPRTPLMDCLRAIAASDLVVGSSLHGIVVAEALGIPARLVASRAEPPFKYADYYLGTGRASYLPAPDVEAAIARGGEQPPQWDPDPLLAAFPADLWEAAARA